MNKTHTLDKEGDSHARLGSQADLHKPAIMMIGGGNDIKPAIMMTGGGNDIKGQTSHHARIMHPPGDDEYTLDIDRRITAAPSSLVSLVSWFGDLH